MSQFNSINKRKEFGKPPSHYKLIGRSINNPSLQEPNLEFLTSKDRDYQLIFHGNNIKIPLKW